MTPRELAYSDLGDVCGRVKSGELSSVQVTQTILQRIEALNMNCMPM